MSASTRNQRLRLMDEALSKSALRRLRRLTRRSFHRFRHRLKGTPLIKTSTFWGCPLWGIPGETVTESLVGSGAFEASNARLMLESAQEGMVIFDVGAHIGFFSALAAWIAGPLGQVHLFEPTPSTFDILTRNAEFMRRYCPVIVPNMAAVGSHAGSAVLIDCGSAMCTRNTLAHSPRFADQSVVDSLETHNCEVRVITLDKYCAHHEIRPDYIKVDAESFELEIVKGAKRIISEYHPLVTLEVGDCNVAGAPSSADIVDAMIDCGYAPYQCDVHGLSTHTPLPIYQEVKDILFVPTMLR